MSETNRFLALGVLLALAIWGLFAYSILETLNERHQTKILVQRLAILNKESIELERQRRSLELEFATIYSLENIVQYATEQGMELPKVATGNLDYLQLPQFTSQVGFASSDNLAQSLVGISSGGEISSSLIEVSLDNSR